MHQDKLPEYNYSPSSGFYSYHFNERKLICAQGRLVNKMCTQSTPADTQMYLSFRPDTLANQTFALNSLESCVRDIGIIGCQPTR